MKILTKALRNILEETIDCALNKKLRLRSEAEDRLTLVENESQIATADLVALFRGVLEIQRQQDSISADRYSLLKF
jgi:hypothetical protein